MRGVTTIVTVVVLLAMYQLVAGAVIEPVGNSVNDAHDWQDVDGEGITNTTYDVVYKWVPLVVFAGMLMWAVAYYLRRERHVGARRGGGGGGRRF